MENRFLSRAAAAIAPYVPGEQPRDMRYIKLNTNECPYPPSPAVQKALATAPADELRLYPDPDAAAFTAVCAEVYGLAPEQVLLCGGSDEALAFSFMAFSDRGDNVYFPDITYGFYRVYADLFRLTACMPPLGEDFTIAPEDYYCRDGSIFIANPNAPTGIVLPPESIEEILRRNPDQVVIVDEAYADFAPGSSCVPLLAAYDNLLVVRTFSKSRALAGMRLGAAMGSPALIGGLNRIKYSFNPYNLDRVSMAVGIAALQDAAWFELTTARVIATRERSAARLRSLGFTVLPSGSNFLFACRPGADGGEIYRGLRERGILVRHFEAPRIRDYVRITVGDDNEMDTLLATLEEML